MTAIFLSFVKQKSLLKSRLERSENVENWITIYVCMRPTSAAGAGMGVDSGLPDFRGKEGFWQGTQA